MKTKKTASDTYHIQNVLNKATETHTVPIYRTIRIHIVLETLSIQTATDGTHYASCNLFLSLKPLHRNSSMSSTEINSNTQRLL